MAKLTTVHKTSTLRLNLHPNSPKTQLRVNKLLLKKMMPAKGTSAMDDNPSLHVRTLLTSMNYVRHGQIDDQDRNRCSIAL